MKIELEFTPKQGEAYANPAQFLLYGGAKGGGKSWFLCCWIFAQATHNPHSKWFFFRKRGVDFTNTTLETWKKAIPVSQYSINPNSKKITMKGSRAVIDYGGLDDEQAVEKLNSAEYSGGAIDQAEEITKDSFAMCRGTLRHKKRYCTDHDNSCSMTCPNREYAYQIRMSANPRQCWLKNDFILAPKKGFKFIQALPVDNCYLPGTYVENLREAYGHREEMIQAYLYGSWDEAEGHDICIRNADIQSNKDLMPHGSIRKRIIVNDPSHFGNDENVTYVFEQTDTLAYVIHQELVTKRDTMDTSGRLAALKFKYDATDIFVDCIGIGAGICDQLAEQGQPVHRIASSSKPTNDLDQKKYLNLRAQMWMEAGEKFAKRQAKTHDDILDGQLSSITFDYKPNGVMQVQSKADIKKKLGNSPDRADAFVMGLWALDQAKKLDEQEYIESTTDRVGRGTPVETFQEQYTIFPEESYA